VQSSTPGPPKGRLEGRRALSLFSAAALDHRVQKVRFAEAERGSENLKALVAGEQVSAIACERPGDAKVFYAKTLDEVRAWAEEARKGRL